MIFFSKEKKGQNLTGLEVIQEDVHGLRLLSEVSDSNTRTTNNLTGVTLTINLTETGPFTELLGIRNLDQVDVVLGTESFNELDVFRLGTRLTENSQMSLTSVKSLDGFLQTTGKTIVNESTTEDFLKSIFNGHLTGGGLNGNFDFLSIDNFFVV